jgi:ABC-type lipoprotein export system ATPase subunit
MIRLDKVSKTYRTERIETTALDNVNLEIDRGELVSIMGPSGCGKSPTGNLDSQMGDEIMEILEGLNRNEGTTVVMVTHDPRLAERTHRIVRLFDGRQVQ